MIEIVFFVDLGGVTEAAPPSPELLVKAIAAEPAEEHDVDPVSVESVTADLTELLEDPHQTIPKARERQDFAERFD